MFRTVGLVWLLSQSKIVFTALSPRRSHITASKQAVTNTSMQKHSYVCVAAVNVLMESVGKESMHIQIS